MLSPARTIRLLSAYAVLGMPAAAAPVWQVYQLTSGAASDTQPDVSGTSYVWQRGGQAWLWTEGDPQPVVVSTTTGAQRPRISLGRIVWEFDPGHYGDRDWEIMLWKPDGLTRLTSNDYDDRYPDVGGYGLVWRDQGNGYLIYDNGQQQFHLTANGAGMDSYPSVSNDVVVWSANTLNNSDIYYWKHGSQTQLTSADYDNVLPETDGHSVVWQAASGPGGSTEILEWAPERGSFPLTDNAVYDVQPDVSGDVVVFARDDGQDYEIFFRYLGVEYQLTNNTYDDLEPQVDGNRIVWEGHDGGSHIFYAVLDGLAGGETAGACCQAITCTVTTESICGASGGTFRGPDTLCTVDACGTGPAPTWSTFQHDAQRTGRTTAIVAADPVRIWSVVVGVAPYDNVPTIGPDGTVYVGSGDSDFAAFSPSGDLRWNKELFPRGPAALRQDGRVLLPGWDRFYKLDRTNGSWLCERSSMARLAAALDSEGNSYYFDAYTGALQLRKLDAACQDVWAYPLSLDLTAPPALALDGSVLYADAGHLRKLHPATGELVWSITTPEGTGGPAVGPGETIYFTVDEDDSLWARYADGSERWTHHFNDSNFKIRMPFTGSLAIATDGTVYVPGAYGYPEKPALVAVAADGSERWQYVSSEESARAPAPAVDGEGKVVFSNGTHLTALAPASGATIWQVETGPAKDAPAIAEDGTVYLVTAEGRLIALGVGCPEDVTARPPYSFRLAARGGQSLNGYTIDNFLALEMRPDGRVAFKADMSGTPGTAVFMEQVDSTYVVVPTGSDVDGHVVTGVDLPRTDASGNVYLPAETADLGRVVFLNGQLFLQTGTPGSAPVTIASIAPGFESYLNPNNAGRFLIYGTRLGDTWPGLLSVDIVSGEVTPLLLQYGVIDGFEAAAIWPAEVHGYGDDGIPVARLEDTGQFAVATPSSLIVRTGDIIDGFTVQTPVQPRRDASGAIYYLGTGTSSRPIFHHAPSGEHHLLRGTGTSVAGQPIVDFDYLDVNGFGTVAYLARLLGDRNGVFVDDDAVAVEGVTAINGLGVARVGGEYPQVVSINELGSVAFVARLADGTEALVVATPDSPADQDGDWDVDLIDYSYLADCIHGPGELIPPECAMFDLNGNCRVDLEDFARFQILMNADCNANGTPDLADILGHISTDCDANLVPDECDIQDSDCNQNGVPDACDLSGGTAADCNRNRVPDTCDLAAGTSLDRNANGVPDECDPDCNSNGTPDDLDVACGTSRDCQSNGIPDECELAQGTSPDCNHNAIPDACDVAAGTSADCGANLIPDECEPDCNSNGFADSCDIALGTSADCNRNGYPDDCELAAGTSPDCDTNGVPDGCDPDCNKNGTPDACEPGDDCNYNGVRDYCDLAVGTSVDWDENGVPDDCELDCNSNGTPDVQEWLGHDCNANHTLDVCEAGYQDCNSNGISDSCELWGYRLAYAIHGEKTGDLFGWDIANVGDVNGDGNADLVVGAIYAGNSTGRTYLYALGPSGAVLLQRVDGLDRFGWNIVAAGDVNADGIPDYAIGSPMDDVAGSNAGTVAVVSGANRTVGGVFTAHPGVLRYFTRGNYSGYALGSLPDQSRILLATRGGSGHAFVIAGVTGNDVAHLVGGGTPTARISDAGEIGDVGDLIGHDGVHDFVVTEDGNLNGTRGTLFLVDGTISTTGSVLITSVAAMTLVGPRNGDAIGMNEGRGQRTVVPILDVSGDGLPDLLVSAFHSDVNGVGSGSVLVYDGATGSVRYRIDGAAPYDWYGNAVASLGDLGQDGYGDFIVGARGDNNQPNHIGYARVYQGFTASPLQTLSDGFGGFGAGVVTVGDLNGDGQQDLAISNYNQGTVYVYVSGTLDCNGNGRPDACDADCNGDGTPDDCEADCNTNGVADDCELLHGTAVDCNSNGIPDGCDLASETSHDLDTNGIPDECEPDCNTNEIPDAHDIALGTSFDIDSDGIPDECALDCNTNGAPDSYDISQGTSADCNTNGTPDECDIHSGRTGKLYWAAGGGKRVQRANLDGTGLETVITSSSSLWAVAVDFEHGKLYWSAYAGPSIWRANLDGTGAQAVYTGSSWRPHGLALTGAGLIYWCDTARGWLNRGPIDGGTYENLMWGRNSPEGIALDLVNGQMYWSESSYLYRANLDGTVVVRVAGALYPQQVALDVAHQKLYCAESGGHTIKVVNCDGTGDRYLITGLGTPLGIALDLVPGKIYWTDSSLNRIQRANLDGTNVQDVIVTGLNQPTMMDIIPTVGSQDANGNHTPDECE
jgi:hypothetical protein